LEKIHQHTLEILLLSRFEFIIPKVHYSEGLLFRKSIIITKPMPNLNPDPNPNPNHNPNLALWHISAQ